MRITGIEYDTLSRYSQVCAAIQIERRVESLSFEHHRRVVHLPPAEQDQWLVLAVENNLSTRRLKESIGVGRLLSVEEMVKPKQIALFNLIHPHISRISSCFRKRPLESMSQHELMDLRDDLEPVRMICNKLEGLINDPAAL